MVHPEPCNNPPRVNTEKIINAWLINSLIPWQSIKPVHRNKHYLIMSIPCCNPMPYPVDFQPFDHGPPIGQPTTILQGPYPPKITTRGAGGISALHWKSGALPVCLRPSNPIPPFPISSAGPNHLLRPLPPVDVIATSSATLAPRHRHVTPLYLATWQIITSRWCHPTKRPPNQFLSKTRESVIFIHFYWFLSRDPCMQIMPKLLTELQSATRLA